MVFSTVLGVNHRGGGKDTRALYLSFLATTILGDDCRALQSQHKYDILVDIYLAALLSVEPSHHQ